MLLFLIAFPYWILKRIGSGNILKVLRSKLKKNVFDDEIFNLMDFDCDQRDSVHFFYTLPYTKNKALIETTWLSKIKNDSLKDYDEQLKKLYKKSS